MIAQTRDTSSLSEQRIETTLNRLHAASGRDWRIFATAAPAILAGWLRGRGVEASMGHRLRSAYLPIAPEQGRLLYQLARATGARRVVEFGSSFGISTLYLAAAVRDNGGGQVIGSELEANKVQQARSNFEQAGLADLIELRAGDALETLASVGGPIDLLFLDGWKNLCLPVLRLLEDRLASRAMVVCDDVRLFKRALRPYLEYVRGSGRYVSTELPLGDGMELSVRS